VSWPRRIQDKRLHSETLQIQSGPKGLRADIGFLKRFRIIKHGAG
jgi:hypothetical protein